MRSRISKFKAGVLVSSVALAMTLVVAVAFPSSAQRETRGIDGLWTFSEVFSYDLGEYWAESDSVAVADFNNDGIQDIALLLTARQQPPYNWKSKVILMTSQGDWQFAITTIAEYPHSYGYVIRTADLDNDGWADLVVRADFGTRVLLNDQSGGFVQSWVGGPGYGAMALHDVNGDSFPDILSGAQTGAGGQVEVFLNNGSGTSFSKSWESTLFGGNVGTIYKILGVTLNDDGAPDIVATEIYSGTLVTFVGNGTGTLFVQRDLLDLGSRAFGLAAGNVNGDSLTDFAVHVGWGQTQVFAGDTGSVQQVWQSPNLGQAAMNVSLADFDKDGFDDLFVGTFADGGLRIYRNRSGSDFELAWNGSLQGRGYTGFVADLDNNGYPDLIVGEQDTNQQGTLRVLRNNLFMDRYVFLPNVLK